MYMNKLCDSCGLDSTKLNAVHDQAGVHVLDFCDSCYAPILESQKNPRTLAPDERAY